MMIVRATDSISRAIGTQLGIRVTDDRSSYEEAELSYLEALYWNIMAASFEKADDTGSTGAESLIHRLSRTSRVETELELTNARTSLIEAILEGDTDSNRGATELLEDFTRNLTAYIDSLAKTITTIDAQTIIRRELALIDVAL